MEVMSHPSPNCQGWLQKADPLHQDGNCSGTFVALKAPYGTRLNLLSGREMLA
jgi:hypothetical protein